MLPKMIKTKPDVDKWTCMKTISQGVEKIIKHICIGNSQVSDKRWKINSV